MPEPASKAPPAALPRGLAMFPDDLSPAHRRRRWIFLVVHLLVAAGLVLPLAPAFAGPATLLGLPAPMTWAVGALAVEFLALLWLFRHEPERGAGGERRHGRGGEG